MVGKLEKTRGGSVHHSAGNVGHHGVWIWLHWVIWPLETHSSHSSVRATDFGWDISMALHGSSNRVMGQIPIGFSLIGDERWDPPGMTAHFVELLSGPEPPSSYAAQEVTFFLATQLRSSYSARIWFAKQFLPAMRTGYDQILTTKSLTYFTTQPI